MTVQQFHDIPSALRAIARDNRAREKRVRVATRKAAREIRGHVIQNIPRAFGELAESVDVVVHGLDQVEVRVDAPHAAAVENGSRPHTPPLAPLVAWVTLRGLQGLTRAGAVANPRPGPYYKNPTPETAQRYAERLAARSIARALKQQLGSKGAGLWKQRVQSAYDKAANPRMKLSKMNADPAVVAIARAIQFKIAHEGTKPNRYMGRSMPFVMATLDQLVKEALPDA